MTKLKQQYNKHIALAYCEYCWRLLVSSGGGVFVSCDCSEQSFIDQERFSAHYVRLGGNSIKYLGQICPQDCEERSHKNNLKLKYDKNNTPSIVKPNIKKKRQISKTKLRNKRTKSRRNS